MTLVERVREFCRSRDLFTPGPVVVGVSGGADSLTLLHILIQLRDEFGITLHVATLDHGIRGEAGAEDVLFVQAIARNWGVPCTADRIEVPRLAESTGKGFEEAAREARYAYFFRVAEGLHTRTIAVAHNQDDLAETVLMHVIRGSGLAGLRGMRAKTTVGDTWLVVRPLLDISRAEIESYLGEIGVTARYDATNSDLAYTRNRVRHQVMPLLAEINPNVRQALARTAAIAVEDYAALAGVLPEILRSGPAAYVRDDNSALPLSQRRLLIREMAYRLAPDLDLSFERIHAAAVLSANLPGGKMDLGQGVWLNVGKTFLMWDRRAFPEYFPWMPVDRVIKVDHEGVYELSPNGWKLAAERLAEVPDSLLAARRESRPVEDGKTLILAVPKGESITVRTRRAGDRFPLAMGHTQKLSDTFINMQVPHNWRDDVPLATIAGQIAAFVVPVSGGTRVRARVAVPFEPADRTACPIWRLRLFRN
ncbi:MAG TPA: tRNA lysidine(34) synthetase TilS [Aggregatilineales bacterium]|nr:tRNA lysidine(34) synthetase TilS [Aggregatilineales bacterium]